MIGVLIFTHGQLSDVLRAEAERLSGHRDRVCCLSMTDNEGHDVLRGRVLEAVKALDDGHGVMALVDVVGGTPWNLCGEIAQTTGHAIRRIGGGGIPLVIKALQDHGEHHDLDAWSAELEEYAHNRLRSD